VDTEPEIGGGGRGKKLRQNVNTALEEAALTRVAEGKGLNLHLIIGTIEKINICETINRSILQMKIVYDEETKRLGNLDQL
jgi:hypothetical protein